MSQNVKKICIYKIKAVILRPIFKNHIKKSQTMPKQSGIYQIKGKFEQRSYYRPKNMSTGVFRAINQQMSERVKTEPNYAITRNYAGEFGCASSWANQVASYLNTLAPISNLVKKRTDIAQSALGMIRQDTEHEFGKRTLTIDGWQRTMMSLLNNLPRVSFDGTFGSNMSFYSYEDTTTGSGKYKLHVNMSSVPNLSDRLKTIGANFIEYRVYVCRWWAGYYTMLLGKYYPAELYTIPVDVFYSTSLPHYTDCDVDFPLDGDYPSFAYMKVLVTATPMREFNDATYALEHLRTFKFFDLPRQDTFIQEISYNGKTYRQGSRAFEIDTINNPNMRVTMHLESGTTITSPTVIVNGVRCDTGRIDDNHIDVKLSKVLDVDTMRILAITFGGNTYKFETKS